MGIGFAIPTSTARSVMDAIVRDGKVTRGWIGVEPQDLTPELAESFSIPSGTGVIITGVLQNGPAAQAGIRPGDVVTQVGDKPVSNVSQLLSAVAALAPGEPSSLEIVRKDGKQRIQITPGKRNLPRPQPNR
jgi:S1-C subfamily serine protease